MFSHYLIHLLNAKFSGYHFSVKEGRKYDRIICATAGREQFGEGRIYLFVDKISGDVIKPGGWKTPQRNSSGELAIRGNVNTVEKMESLVAAADPYGTFLYYR